MENIFKIFKERKYEPKIIDSKSSIQVQRYKVLPTHKNLWNIVPMRISWEIYQWMSFSRAKWLKEHLTYELVISNKQVAIYRTNTNRSKRDL